MKCALSIKNMCLMVAIILLITSMYLISTGFFQISESFTSGEKFNGDIGDDLNIIKQSLDKGKKCVIVFHAASWCGWSVKLIPVWNEFYEKQRKLDENVQVFAIEDTNIENREEAVRSVLGMDVPNGFPTIVSIQNGVVKKFSGERTVNGLLSF